MASNKYTLSIGIQADAESAKEQFHETATSAANLPDEINIPVKAKGCEDVNRQLVDIQKRLKGIRGEFGSGFMSGLFGTNFHNTSVSSIVGTALGTGIKTAIIAPFKIAFSAVGTLASAAGSIISEVLLAPVNLLSGAFGVLKGAASGALSMISSIVGGLRSMVGFTMQLVKPAGDFQQYKNSLEVLLKDSTKAKQRFEELKKYAKDTNFNPDEVISAGSRLQAFGLWNQDGMKRLKLAGDLANSFGRSLEEVVTSINYLASGRGGEAFESLSRMGITRDKLKPFGVQFGTSGNMITEPKTAINALFKYIEQNMGGMTYRMGKTWKGAIAQLGGAWQDAFGEGMQGALDPLSDFVGDLTEALGGLKAFLKSVKWKELLQTPLDTISGLVKMLSDIADPEKRSQGMKELKGIWKGLKDTFSAIGTAFWDTGAAFISGLGTVLVGVFSDLGKAFDTMQKDGTWGKLIGQFMDGFSDVGIGAIQFLKATLDSFCGRFISGLTMLYEKLNLFSDKTETAKYMNARSMAARVAKNDMTPEQRKQYEMEKSAFFDEKRKETYLNLARKYRDKDIARMWSDNRASVVERIAPSAFKSRLEKEMGWGIDNGGMERMKGAGEKMMAGFTRIIGASKSVWGNMDFSNTKAAASQAGANIMSAASTSFGNVKDVFMNEVVAPASSRGRQERLASAEKELAGLQKELSIRMKRKNDVDGSGVYGYLSNKEKKAYHSNEAEINTLRGKIASASENIRVLRESPADGISKSVETPEQKAESSRRNNAELADMIVERFAAKFKGFDLTEITKSIKSLATTLATPLID